MVRPGAKAEILRVVGMTIGVPLQVFGYTMVSGRLWYGVLLALAPLATGWIGLISRAIFDIVADRTEPRVELSGKGAILAATTTFAVLLFVAPVSADRGRLAAVFLAGAIFYYAVGKCGCFVIGCCRAIALGPAWLPLPALEAIAAAIISGFAVGSFFLQQIPRFWAFVGIALLFAALRIFSRCARGLRFSEAIAKADSVALLAVASATLLLLVTQRLR